MRRVHERQTMGGSSLIKYCQVHVFDVTCIHMEVTGMKVLKLFTFPQNGIPTNSIEKGPHYKSTWKYIFSCLSDGLMTGGYWDRNFSSTRISLWGCCIEVCLVGIPLVEIRLSFFCSPEVKLRSFAMFYPVM